MARASKQIKPDGKYSFLEIYNYLIDGDIPLTANNCKQYNHGLQKRSKYFTTMEGRLYYIGGGARINSDRKSRLVIENTDERERIIKSIHDQAHLGRDKTVSAISNKYYWPNMYNEVCLYVSCL